MTRTAPKVFGILNVTPDSFSDGGQYPDLTAAIGHGITLFEQHTLVDLITTRKLGLPGNRCLGLYALDSDTDSV